MSGRSASGTINWTGPNWLTFFAFAIALAIAIPQPGNLVRDFVTGHPWMFGIVSVFVRRITLQYSYSIEDFSPKTALEAKRANEQIKSLSTAINALAAGSAVTVTVKQLSEDNPNYPLIIMAIGLSIWVHTGARHLLGLLKDESLPTSSDGKEQEPQ